jgi:phosphoesterase RecJ-like protein
MKQSIPIKNLLNTWKKALIVCHINPDGDSVGSMIGLSLLLKQLHISSFLVCRDAIPRTYMFLPEAKKISTTLPKKDSYHGVIAIDCGDKKRFGFDIPVDINIDHHLGDANFGRLNLVKAEHAAVGEIIYVLAKKWGLKITPQIATCLYTAVMTDTGSFQYSNTNALSFRIVADLVEHGAQPSIISRHVYESETQKGLRLLGHVLTSFKVEGNGRIIWVDIPDVPDEEAKGIIDHLRRLEGAEIVITFRAIKGGKVKVGMRSKGKLDVFKIATRFNGGGHSKASGCTLAGTLNEAHRKIIPIIKAGIGHG